MALEKPLKRTIRSFTNGTYSEGGHWKYLLHPKFANNPQHYIRSFLIIQDDLFKLFEFVEPCDQNSKTISLRIQELLFRVCIEIEANFTAILKENKYSNKKNWNLEKDYCLIEFSHKLSAFSVKFPVWKGERNTFFPFKNWSRHPMKNWHSLEWYQAYNKSKHDRYGHFNDATFETLLNAVSGLVVLLSSQFLLESFSTKPKVFEVEGDYSYDYDPRMLTAIGDYFRVQFPTNWEPEEQYDFSWEDISSLPEPFDKIDFDLIKNKAFKYLI